MAAYLPPGWPAGVHPPDSPDFERTAVAWLLDVVPPDYRLYGVLRRYPLALATMAGHHARACVEGARQGYRTARTQLAEVLPAQAMDAVLAAYRAEGQRLTETVRAVELIATALRGDTFTPQLRDEPPPRPRARPASGRPAGGRPATDQRAQDQRAQDQRAQDQRAQDQRAQDQRAVDPAAGDQAAGGRGAGDQAAGNREPPRPPRRAGQARGAGRSRGQRAARPG